jgi:hypothetical protein
MVTAPTTEGSQPQTKPGFSEILDAALPAHTHAERPFLGFGDTRWTWTTTDGVWTIKRGPMLTWYELTGPGGRWSVDEQRLIPVLRALGAIPATEED